MKIKRISYMRNTSLTIPWLPEVLVSFALFSLNIITSENRAEDTRTSGIQGTSNIDLF